MTSFMLTCKKVHRDVVRLLLDHLELHIEANASVNNGLTAFMWACQKGHK